MKTTTIFILLIMVIFLTMEKIALAESWSASKLTGYNGPVNCEYFIDNQTGFVGGLMDYYMFKTADGGSSWYRVNVPNSVDFSSIMFANASTGYASTENGFVMKTTNGGENWFSAGTPVGVIHALYVFSPTTVIIVAQSGYIYKTTNGGTNWINYSVSYSGYGPYSVTFAPSGKGFAVADAPSPLWMSTNSGNNWTLSNPFTGFIGKSVRFNGNVGFIAGSLGSSYAIQRTTDDGTTWSNETFAAGQFECISFANALTGYAVGYSGSGHDTARVYKTTDNGITWNQVFQKVGIIYSVACTQSNVFLGCDSGNVMSSGLIGIQPISTEIPKNFSLGQNYPNPFNPTTDINISIRESGNVKVTVFDVSGKEVAVLVNQIMKPGIYKVDFNASNLTSGVYFYRIVSSSFTETKKMVLVK